MQWFNAQRRRIGRSWLNYLALAVTACVLGMTVLGRSPALASPARHYTELEFGPPPEIVVPDYTRFELDNGIKVYLLEDHELPLVQGTAMFHSGGRLEATHQTGLADITGEVIRSGGTRLHPADRLNQILEQRAASVETSIDATVGSASFNTLSEDLDEVFALFAEVVRRPALPQAKIDLSKTQWRGQIARRNDDPDDIANREFQKLIYGPDSPYARTVEYETLDNIRRQDVRAFYQTYFAPNNMLLGVVGDFDPAEMRSRIESAFSDWQPNPNLAAQPLPEVSPAQLRGIFMVNQPQLSQSYIQIGHLGGQLDNPDHAALSIMNEVLNGLGGRLVNEVRSRQGLAYSVYAYWSPRFDYPGLFIGGGQTRSEATVPFVQSVKAEIEKIRTAPITEVELNRAKDSVLNAFIFNFQSPGQTLSRVMRYEYYGYPEDFIFRYQNDVEATTVDDVLRAAQTHLQPDQLVTLVVGNGAAMQPPLSALSPDVEVTQIDVTIPQPRG